MSLTYRLTGTSTLSIRTCEGRISQGKSRGLCQLLAPALDLHVIARSSTLAGPGTLATVTGAVRCIIQSKVMTLNLTLTDHWRKRGRFMAGFDERLFSDWQFCLYLSL